MTSFTPEVCSCLAVGRLPTGGVAVRLCSAWWGGEGGTLTVSRGGDVRGGSVDGWTGSGMPVRSCERFPTWEGEGGGGAAAPVVASPPVCTGLGAVIGGCRGACVGGAGASMAAGALTTTGLAARSALTAGGLVAAAAAAVPSAAPSLVPGEGRRCLTTPARSPAPPMEDDPLSCAHRAVGAWSLVAGVTCAGCMLAGAPSRLGEALPSRFGEALPSRFGSLFGGRGAVL